MTTVVIFDNIRTGCSCKDAKNTTGLVDQGSTQSFNRFPDDARSRCWFALTIAAEGNKADVAKPLRGLGSGIFEIAVQVRGDAFRLIYALLVDRDIWVLHAFKKKSTTGIKTPQREIEVIAEMLKRLKDVLR